jgi:hypothetical protein
MIVQSADDGLMLFRQTDHALLSGAFAVAWGNDVVPRPAHFEQTVVAAARHDDGWAHWELAPKLRDDGDPVDFIRVPVADHVPLYKRGIDLVEQEGNYAGLLASLHGQRLYTRPFHPGMDPRIEHLKAGDLEIAQAYVDGEDARQRRLIEALGEEVRDDADEGWRLLQVWDRMSLFACMQPMESGAEQAFPFFATANGDAQITATVKERNVVALDPYPFAEPEAEFDIAYVQTSRSKWSDEETFRREFRAARRGTLRFRCVPR